MSVRACIDRVVPGEFRIRAARAAALEHPENLPPGIAPEMAVEHRKLWTPGRTLRIRFLQGSPRVRQRVRHYAEQWLQYANLRMEFVGDGPAEIRIGFEDTGSWSAVGTDALVTEYFEPAEATMNFGWLADDSSDEELGSVVLHEFGHALGCVHEHESPAADIKWNKPVVYRDLAGPPNFWDKATVDGNVFARYSEAETKYTVFDRDSIMLYAFPASWTLDGQAYEQHSALSALDRRFIRECYPAFDELAV
jgi:hypothetical protein